MTEFFGTAQALFFFRFRHLAVWLIGLAWPYGRGVVPTGRLRNRSAGSEMLNKWLGPCYLVRTWLRPMPNMYRSTMLVTASKAGMLQS